MNKGSWDEAYVCLRDLLKARLVKPETKNAAERAILEIHKEALSRTMIDSVETDALERKSDVPPKAA